jgi:FKBP-type peptidyl-prolyl cis-trans isomerase FklB
MATTPSPILRFPLGLALSALVVALGSHDAAAQAPAAVPPPGASATAPAATAHAKENASYSLGLAFATQWRDSGLEGLLSEADLIRGIRAGLAGTPLTADDRQRASTFMHDAYEAWGTRNKLAAADFLARNAKQPGVKTTASGLQYIVLNPGDTSAPKAGAGDHVMVQYRGRLINGTEFDSTYSRGKPGVIRPSDTIAGWREALEMMAPGAKWRVFVPPDLAYALTPPPSIPPNSLLIFEIELLKIEQAGSPPPAAAVR